MDFKNIIIFDYFIAVAILNFKKGVFPFFYQLKDTGRRLTGMDLSKKISIRFIVTCLQ
jgi:hypothetical protein